MAAPPADRGFAEEAWMLEAVSQPDGSAPIVQIFAVGYGTEEECIRKVKAHPGIEPGAVVTPRRRLSACDIQGIGLKEGEIKQQ
jgi:hypothetical protein